MMLHSTMIVAALSMEPTLRELLQFALSGLFVVLVALSALAFTCAGVGRLLKLFERPAPVVRMPTSTSDEVADEVVAVIAAAVSTMLDRPHRIVHVRGLTPEDAAWALEGRRQLHSSHTFSHRDVR